MLEKTLESPLNCKIKPVNPKAISPEYSLDDWCWRWNSKTLATWCKELTHWKRPWCWERLKVGEGDDRGWDGWMASLTQWTWVQAALGVGDGQGSLACYSPRGCKESGTTEQLNWTDWYLRMECILKFIASLKCYKSGDNNDFIVTACTYVTLVITVYNWYYFICVRSILGIKHWV